MLLAESGLHSGSTTSCFSSFIILKQNNCNLLVVLTTQSTLTTRSYSLCLAYMVNLNSLGYSACMSLDCGRQPTQAQGEQANSTQKGPGQGRDQGAPCCEATMLTTPPLWRPLSLWRSDLRGFLQWYYNDTFSWCFSFSKQWWSFVLWGEL